MKSTAREQKIYRATILGGVGNLALLIFKFAAGFLGHSAAMIADAVHSFSDFVTDIIVLVFVRVSSKPSDAEHDYGHGKFETLATSIIAVLLFLVGVGLLWSGSRKIWDFAHGVELEEPGIIALVAAILSIIVKEGLYRYTKIVAKRENSPALEANAWHHRSDAFSSIGTALGIGGAIFFGANGRVLDPVAAIIVSLFIMRVAVEILTQCVDELLEKSLPKEQEDLIIDAISLFPEAHKPHKLRTRRIGPYAAVDFHVRMDPQMTVGASHQVASNIEKEIKRRLGEGTIVNIHVEPFLY